MTDKLRRAIAARDRYWSEQFGDAVQADCEHGVRSLNEMAAAQYLAEAPMTRQVINAIHKARETAEDDGVLK